MVCRFMVEGLDQVMRVDGATLNLQPTYGQLELISAQVTLPAPLLSRVIRYRSWKALEPRVE